MDFNVTKRWRRSIIMGYIGIVIHYQINLSWGVYYEFEYLL